MNLLEVGIPTVPLRGMVVYPNIVIHLDIGRDKSIKAVEKAMENDRILAVVTQPDRPKGRGNKLLQTPVKEYALAQGLTVYQPQKVKTPEFVELLHELQSELIVVAAFGQFLSKEILELPKYGCINLHVSLLPKYRGSAPVQWAVLNGDAETGVSIMQMDEGLDTGDVLA